MLLWREVKRSERWRSVKMLRQHSPQDNESFAVQKSLGIQLGQRSVSDALRSFFDPPETSAATGKFAPISDDR